MVHDPKLLVRHQGYFVGASALIINTVLVPAAGRDEEKLSLGIALLGLISSEAHPPSLFMGMNGGY